MSKVKKYKKKPVVIEAIQLTPENHDDAMEFSKDLYFNEDDGHINNYVVKTLEGDMVGNVGDFLIKGVNGEFYPCKPDIFEKTYELYNSGPENDYDYVDGVKTGI